MSESGISPDFPDERLALADAGRRLLKAGLVARTWGNLSIKVSDTQFLITPSGRNYETLEAAHMALVSIEDLSWGGDMKPSSEKELHARIYRNRSDIGAVIHTHQPAASSLAAARTGFSPTRASGDAQRVGAHVPCVPYALPTTKALAVAVEKTLIESGPDCRALLLSNHGAVCTGGDITQALTLAENLENAAENHILENYRGAVGDSEADRIRMLADAAGQKDSKVSSAEPAFKQKLSGNLVAHLQEKLGDKIFLVSENEWVRAAADRGSVVRPMLDDQAQLIGVDLPVVDLLSRTAFSRVRRILGRKGFGGRTAVLIKGIGCICAADDTDDAAAVAMVAEKGCRVSIESVYLGGGHSISRAESLLMRLIYLLKYSKKAG